MLTRVFRVTLCKTCHRCVWPDSARTKFRKERDRLPEAERALVCDERQSWRELFQLTLSLRSSIVRRTAYAQNTPGNKMASNVDWSRRDVPNAIGKRHASGARLGKAVDPGLQSHLLPLFKYSRTHGNPSVSIEFFMHVVARATWQYVQKRRPRTVLLNGEPRIQTQ